MFDEQDTLSKCIIVCKDFRSLVPELKKKMSHDKKNK